MQDTSDFRTRLLLAAAAASLLLASGAAAQDSTPITLSEMGSFHVGGKVVPIEGQPVREVVFTPGGQPLKIDLNGDYMAGQMYVQYFIPAKPRGKYPLLMWHGGGLTGVSYETTPDGREGWLNYFLRRDWPVYVSDAVERGRSGWAQFPNIFAGEPLFPVVKDPWERYRIGAGPGSYSSDEGKRSQLEGSTFPADVYLNFIKQNVPRWTTTDDFIFDAYRAEIEKVCPCVLMIHSQAGKFGYIMAQEYPDLVKGVVAVEPASIGKAEDIAKLADIPMLMLWGDFIEGDARWPTLRDRAVAFAEAVNDAGGKVDVVHLPEAGITGNSHMVMMDTNSDEVAALIQDWLQKQGLWE